MLTGRKHTKILRPGGGCLNRETPGKSRRIGRNADKDFEDLSNSNTGIFKIHDNFRDWNYRRLMRPEIDASYQHISKSEATNLDHDFIVLALNKLENQNTIFIKPTSQGFDSFFIAAHTGIKDQQNIKPLTQHDNVQLNPIYFQPKLNLI